MSLPITDLDGGVSVANWPKRPGGSDITGWDACGYTVTVSVTLYTSGCPEDSMEHTLKCTQKGHASGSLKEKGMFFSSFLL